MYRASARFPKLLELSTDSAKRRRECNCLSEIVDSRLLFYIENLLLHTVIIAVYRVCPKLLNVISLDILEFSREITVQLHRIILSIWKVFNITAQLAQLKKLYSYCRGKKRIFCNPKFCKILSWRKQNFWFLQSSLVRKNKKFRFLQLKYFWFVHFHSSFVLQWPEHRRRSLAKCDRAEVCEFAES